MAHRHLAVEWHTDCRHMRVGLCDNSGRYQYQSKGGGSVGFNAVAAAGRGGGTVRPVVSGDIVITDVCAARHRVEVCRLR